jgi:hypothetical protein
VFFFFRELLATDCFNCPGTSAGTGKGTWVSRVARICKSDLGGRQVLKQVFSTSDFYGKKDRKFGRFGESRVRIRLGKIYFSSNLSFF